MYQNCILNFKKFSGVIPPPDTHLLRAPREKRKKDKKKRKGKEGRQGMKGNGYFGPLRSHYG